MADETGYTGQGETTPSRKLAKSVCVNGTWYRPGDRIPDDVAAKITNPKAWAPATADEAADREPDREPGTASGARLASRVQVNGSWYGPSDEIPDDIAAKITNPKAWAGGMLPTVAGKATTTSTEDTSTAEAGTASTEDTSTADGGDGVSLAQNDGGDGQAAGDTGNGDQDAKPRKGSASAKKN